MVQLSKGFNTVWQMASSAETDNVPPAITSDASTLAASNAAAVAPGAAAAAGAAAAPLLIDTDCGIDDAQAIMLAAAHPEKVEIIAFTTVDGQSAFSTLSVFGQRPRGDDDL